MWCEMSRKARQPSRGLVTPEPQSRDRLPPAFGVDVGGVIADLTGAATGASLLGDRPFETPIVPNALEALRALVSGYFQERVFVVSKAGPKVQERTRAWFEHVHFHERTGISERAVFFARENADKARLCDRLQITHFVDDSVGVIQHLAHLEHRYLFVGGLGSSSAPVAVPAGATVVASWLDLVSLIELTGPASQKG